MGPTHFDHFATASQTCSAYNFPILGFLAGISCTCFGGLSSAAVGSGVHFEIGDVTPSPGPVGMAGVRSNDAMESIEGFQRRWEECSRPLLLWDCPSGFQVLALQAGECLAMVPHLEAKFRARTCQVRGQGFAFPCQGFKAQLFGWPIFSYCCWRGWSSTRLRLS